MFDPAVADCGSQGTASSPSSVPERKDSMGPNHEGPPLRLRAGLRVVLVEMSGLEPPASALRRQRSPN